MAAQPHSQLQMAKVATTMSGTRPAREIIYPPGQTVRGDADSQLHLQRLPPTFQGLKRKTFLLGLGGLDFFLFLFISFLAIGAGGE